MGQERAQLPGPLGVSRFLRNATQVLKQLTDSLKGGAKGKLEWTAVMRRAFEQSKGAMLNTAELVYPVEEVELLLEVDASGTHIGAVLHQQTGSGKWPLGFFSDQLNSAQQKYSAFDRELLACYLGIWHFRWLLEGRPFYFLTDYKLLTFMLQRGQITGQPNNSATSPTSQSLPLICATWQQRKCGSRHFVKIHSSHGASSAGTGGFCSSGQSPGGCSKVLAIRGSLSLAVQKVEVAGVALWCDTSTS